MAAAKLTCNIFEANSLVAKMCGHRCGDKPCEVKLLTKKKAKEHLAELNEGF